MISLHKAHVDMINRTSVHPALFFCIPVCTMMMMMMMNVQLVNERQTVCQHLRQTDRYTDMQTKRLRDWISLQMCIPPASEVMKP